MKTCQTRQLSTYEFIQLEKYCTENKIAYEVIEAFTNGNKILVNLFITNDEAYVKLKWDAHEITEVEKYMEYFLSSDC